MDIVSQLEYNRSRDRFNRLEQHLFLAFSCLAFSASPIKHLNLNNTEITEIPDIANSLGQTFSSNSSSNNYSTKFQPFRNHAENQHLKFKPIIWRRLIIRSLLMNSGMPSQNHTTVRLARMTSTTRCLNTFHPMLLTLCSKLYIIFGLLVSWRTSTVIPIPKPAKDASDPNNYHPIALTSCLCKVMERMVNNRLLWFLERNKLPFQCGFRKQRSTTDHLVRLESLIREAFIQRQHAVAVFFDLEKAYDCTWKYGIMKDLHHAGLRGRLPCFIESFLKT